MNYKDFLNKVSLLQSTFNCYKDYSVQLDKYFKNEDNVKNHKELYDLYINLIFELDKIKKRNK